MAATAIARRTEIQKSNVFDEPFRQDSSSRWENPQGYYEAPGQPGRPSRLDRGSSTTKICQAVPTRVSQTDSPSSIAATVLSRRLVSTSPEP